jgi:hypothetical protein
MLQTEFARNTFLVANKETRGCTWRLVHRCAAAGLTLFCRGTLARQASDWQPQHNEQDMQRLLHLLQDVARGLKLLKSQCIVHADLVSCLRLLAAV